MSKIKPAEIVNNVVKYYQTKFNKVRPLLKQLVQDGQKPHAFVITCSDSRVVPDMVMGSDPGEIFVVRNIGNIVPPSYSKPIEQSVGAALEYAVEVLNVPNIVVMGHGDCGAMKAVLAGQTGLRHVDGWLKYAESSHIRYKIDDEFGAGLAPHDRLSQINVLQQLESLRTYPPVAHRLEAMSITLHAWWFDIETARVLTFNVRKNQFVPLEEVYPVLDPETESLVKQIEAQFVK
jgi:carbonic anhydrase